MMKLKVTLFGVLTAVSLGLVAPYANAADHSFTCEDIKKVSWMVATGTMEGTARQAYGRSVLLAGKKGIYFLMESMSDPKVYKTFGMQDERRLLVNWAESLNHVTFDQVVIESFHRVNVLGSDYILEATQPPDTSGFTSFMICLAAGFGNYIAAEAYHQGLISLE